MTRQKAPWSFAAVDIEVPSSGTREVLLTRASGDWTGWTVDGVTAPASVTDELTVTAPSSLLGRRWRLLDPDGRERIVGCVVAAKAGSASEDLTVDVSTGATIVEVTITGGGGGGAVDSVNGETGVVVLDAADVGAVPTARTITAGTGLTGGGDLSADRTLTVAYGATAGTAAEGNDARLTNARTPTAHAASHQDGGSDELALDGSQITTGTVAPGRLGSGTPSAGTVLRGDGTWAVVPATVFVPAALFMGATFTTPTLSVPISTFEWDRPLRAFPDSATTDAHATISRTPSWAVDVYLVWNRRGATGGNVRWRVASGTDFDTTFTAASPVQYAAQVTQVAAAATITASVFGISVRRLGSDAADTVPGDITIIGVEIRKAGT